MNGYPNEVRIITDPEGAHTLLRNGEPYVVKGANWPTASTVSTLAECGGNSIRTYGNEIEWMLPLAKKHGFTLLVGIHIERERLGFDYTDEKAVAKQREAVLSFVRRYKSEPEVLAWAIGNEPELLAKQTVPLWREVNVLAKLIKAEDPHHPVMTVVASFDSSKIAELIEHSPDLDVLGVNWYGPADRWPDDLRRYGWKKPYLLTEFGPLGYWEAPQNPPATTWGAPVEQTSTQKAKLYTENWLNAVERRKGQSLGGYAFIWTTKQERTHTWFSMFLPSGERLASVDSMQAAWTGKPSAYPSPEILEFKPVSTVDAIKPGQAIAIHLQWNSQQPAEVSVDIRFESTATQAGGDVEPVPITLPNPKWKETPEGLRVTAPSEPGAYRIFVYVKTTNSPVPSAATANLPILVVNH
ncbi:MAG: hypothetical protein ACFCUX_03280 [Candidatus Methylacidiphilales bacterium]